MSDKSFDYNSLIAIASFSPRRLQQPNAWIGHIPFASWLTRQIAPKIFVELGTHSGNSYFSFCQTVKEEKLSTKCYAVDTWSGDEHAGFYESKIFSQVNAHNQEYYAGFSRLLRMTFDEAIGYFADGSIDLLHIDGLHTYEAVKHDFETWLPKLAPGAVVLFHDTNVRESDFGVWELWKELQQLYPLNLEFPHSHGLGVLQIKDASPKKELSWLLPHSAQKEELKSYFAELGLRQIERFEFNSLKTSKLVTEYEENIKDLRKSIDELHAHITEQEDKIVKLYGSVDTKYYQVEALKEVISSRDERILNLNEYLVTSAEQISDLNYSVSRRKMLETQYEEQISTLNNILEEYKEKLTNLEKVFNESKINYEKQIEEHQENIAEHREGVLREIQNSRTWRLTQPLRSAAEIVRNFRSKSAKPSSNNGVPGISQLSGNSNDHLAVEAVSVKSEDNNQAESFYDSRLLMQYLKNTGSETFSKSDDKESIISDFKNETNTETERNQIYKHKIGQIAAKYRSDSKPVVLFVTNRSDNEIEKNVRETAGLLTENKASVLILRPGIENKIILESFNIQDELHIELETDDLKLLADALNAFGIKKAHIHHTFGFNLSIEKLLLLMQIPYDFTVYDYFSIHADGYSIKSAKELAEIIKSNDQGFLTENAKISDNSDDYWRRLRFGSLLNGAEKVICHNQEIADQILKIYPSVSLLTVLSEQTAPNNNKEKHSSDSAISRFYKSEKYWETDKNQISNPTLLLIPEMYGQIPSPCAYIRLIKPLMSDNIQQRFKLRVASVREVSNVRPDIVITNRLPCSEHFELEIFLKSVKDIGAKLVYDIDDNLLYLHDTHPEKSYYEGKAPIVYTLLTESDYVWSSTKKLALHLQPYCKRMRVVENYVDEKLFDISQSSGSSDDLFKIFYMGTSSHKRDLSLVMAALRELVAQGIKFELNLIGIRDERLTEEWVKVIDPPVEAYYYPNFMKWLKTLGHFDLGIAPLEKSIFNECKSDIKFWDYTAMGIPVLASDIMTYNSTIQSGKNGLLADNSVDVWIEKITWAMNNRGQLPILVANASSELKGLAIKRSSEIKRKSSLLKLVNPNFLKTKIKTSDRGST